MYMREAFTVDKANFFIENNKNKVDEKYRHHYHVMAPIGWVNDPNGFVYFQGEYHLFYQYYPYDSCWGPMHWGHTKSRDLIHWEELPVALAPDKPYDKDGCFSGSAIEKDGKLYLMYTGHVEKNDRTYQTQCIAFSEDGIHFEKLCQNPVIDEKILNTNGTIHDFRDPKVFLRNEKYYSVVASKNEEDKGRILLFESKDMLNWSFTSILLEGDATQGIMWECPDLFHLDGKDVLIMSPIQIPKKGDEYHNISSTVAFIGLVNWETGKFSVENYHEIDFGFDFYAPQTLEDNQSRRIMIAWMQMWDRTLPTHDLAHGWAGAMILPRELSVKDNQLIQKPITFVYDSLNITQALHALTVSSNTITFDNSVGDNMYMRLLIDMTEADELTIQLAKVGESSLQMHYDCQTQKFILNREKIGYKLEGREQEVLVQRQTQVSLIDGQLEVELFRDTSSVEIFLNKQKTMSTTFYEIIKGKNLEISSSGIAKIITLEFGQIKA
uniref:glycoside hydrolase family 32 protein n=1 Tax=Candidatus Enterococcus willemsii TaxID=1857215 RepID=UPI00403F60D9